MAALLTTHCKPGSTLGPIKLGPQLALTVYLPEPTRTSTQWALSPSRELLEGIFTGCFSTMVEHSVDIATAAMRAMQPSFPFLCCFSFVDFFVCAAFLVFTHFSCTLCALSICVYINFEMDFSCLESRQQREKMALSAAKKWRAETSAHWRQRVQGQREQQQPRADSVAKGNCINNPEKQKRARERGREG